MLSILQKFVQSRKATALKSIALQKKTKTHQLVSLETMKSQASEHKPRSDVVKDRRNSKPAQSFISQKSKSPKINVHI